MSESRVWARALTDEWCPALDRRLRHPVSVLAAAGTASLLIGLFLHGNGYVLLACVLAVLAVGLVWPWLSVRGLATDVAFSRERAREGETLTVTVRLRNRWPVAAWGLALEHAPGEPPAVVRVAGWSTVEVSWSFSPRCRGEYPTAEPCIVTGFPFGLWRARRRVAIARPCLVWPRTVPVGPVPVGDADECAVGTVASRREGNAGDFLGLRPWRRGDTLRRVHWPQTARHDRLIVRALQACARPSVLLVLDVDNAVHAGAGPDSSREWAIRVAASLGVGWLGQGVPVGLVCAGVTLAPAAGMRHQAALLDQLARIGSNTDSSLGQIMEAADALDEPALLRVVVTTDRAASPGQDARTRYIVLRAAGFGADATPQAAARCRPWIVLEDADRIAPNLLQLPKGGYGGE